MIRQYFATSQAVKEEDIKRYYNNVIGINLPPVVDLGPMGDNSYITYILLSLSSGSHFYDRCGNTDCTADMAIPKLFQWLLGVGSFMAIWLAYVTGHIKGDIPPPFHNVLLILPLYLLIVFACYVLAVIGYRVATFNDCVEASEELQKQIKEAHKDLEQKGYKYASDWK